MLRKFRPWAITWLLVLLVILGWIGSAAYAPVQADIRLESRLNRLESEVSRVRSQVSRIESQLSLPNRSTPAPRIDPPAASADLSLDEQFDNLATLAIETKLQLRDLEARVTQLETYH